MKLKETSLAASLLLAVSSQAKQNTIYSGTGIGTYYYDVQQVDVCGTSFAKQNAGGVRCQNALLPLTQINSNYVVAMNDTQLGGDSGADFYCGKKVVVTSVNGQPVSMDHLPLFIGDGCQRCATGSAADVESWNSTGAPGLDFSYSVLDQLTGGAACRGGHFSITWEILDEKLYTFQPDYSNAPAPAASTPVKAISTPVPAIPAPAAGGGGGQPATVISPPTLGVSPTSGNVVMTATAPIYHQKDNVKVPAARTTLVTTPNPRHTTAAPNPNAPGACPSGEWQCGPNNSVLEQCISGSWTPRATCVAGEVCRGGGTPYCAAAAS